MTADTRDNFALWTGVLLPPAAWALQLQTNYAISRFLCGNAWLAAAFHATTFVTLAAAVAGGAVAFMHWRRQPTHNDVVVDTRQHFMAMIGIALAATFFLLILAQWSARFFIDPCVY
jgi:hypothetical protein